MKNKKLVLIVLASVGVVLLVLLILFFARNVGRITPEGEVGQTQKTTYSCPMHPSFTSDKPGSCAICGMALV